MPYISKKRRGELLNGFARNPGELNYLITLDILDYLDEREENYKGYNEVMGVLECVKQELYRRLIAPYEDKKKEENGDVY